MGHGAHPLPGRVNQRGLTTCKVPAGILQRYSAHEQCITSSLQWEQMKQLTLETRELLSMLLNIYAWFA